MTEPEWPRLRITDEDIDAPEENGSGPPAPGPDPAAPESPALDQPVRRPGLGLRWCAGLATVALVAAAAAVAFAEHRGRTVTSIRYQDAPVHTVDAGGCPNGDNCSPLDGLYGGLASAIANDLPAARDLFAGEMLDTSANTVNRNVRIVELAGSGIRVAVLTQCRPDGALAPSRTQGLTGAGPKLAAVIRPFGPGCSIAVLADVPAGEIAPATAMLRLAEDPQAQAQ